MPNLPKCCQLTFVMCGVILLSRTSHGQDELKQLHNAVSFYASFDNAVTGDFGGGVLTPSTRFDHETEKGKYIYQTGFDERVFQIANGSGVHGAALKVNDVLPSRGRLFFPAKKNVAFNKQGWSGAVSLWLNTDPNNLLKTPYCDPIQITDKRASDGALWIDFPKTKPRNFRMGVYKTLAVGEKPIKDSNPLAPLIRVKAVGFKSGEWHHVVMNWRNLDSGKNNASASLYVDGQLIGLLNDREIAMKWNLDRTGIYFAVNCIGLLDELAIFERALSNEEIKQLHEQPDAITSIKD